MNDTSSNFKYPPTLATTIFLAAVVGTCTILFFGRGYPWLRIEPVTKILPGFYSHVSNFVITLELTLIISFVWVLRDVELKFFLILFATAVVLNVLIESFLKVLNTPDIADAIYGIAAVVIAAIVTLFVRRYGITERAHEHGVDEGD